MAGPLDEQGWRVWLRRVQGRVSGRHIVGILALHPQRMKQPAQLLRPDTSGLSMGIYPMLLQPAATG
ncbi:hypothetical protein GCM10027287_27790 [Bordetella muralis]